MIKRYNNLSFLFFIPGFIVQVAGVVLSKQRDPSQPPSPAVTLLLFGGLVLMFTGFALYSKAKGRSPLWGFCGFLSLLGLIVLALLKDKSGDPWNT